MNEQTLPPALRAARVDFSCRGSDPAYRARRRASAWLIPTVATVMLLAIGTQVMAQNLPAPATPRAALPEPRDQWALPRVQPPPIDIPPVIDRPLSEDDGPRISVDHFSLQFPEAAVLPELRAHLTVIAQAALGVQLTEQPEGGFSLAGLERVAAAVATALRKEGLILAQAYIPVQTVTDGFVEVHVLEGRLGSVSPEGNERYAVPVLRRPFAQLIGRPVQQYELENALLTVSNFPGLAVTGVLGTGDNPGETKLSLRVIDERAFEWAIDADNYGAKTTGELRTQFAFRWNNPSGAGDRIHGRVQQSFDPSNNVYGSLGYERPVPDRRLTVGVDALTSDYDVGQEFTGLGVNGRTYVLSAFLRHELKRNRSVNLYNKFVFNLKRAHVDFFGAQLSKDKLAVLEAGIGVNWINIQQSSINQAYLAYSLGLNGAFGAMNSTGDGASSVVGGSGDRAGGHFDKWMLRFARRQQLTDTHALQLRLFAQHSDDLLTSLEQLSLGGPHTVRSYSPSEVLVDMGGFATLEWIMTLGQALEVTVFGEYGGGKLSDPRTSQFETTDISGYGLSLQLNVARVRARLDLAKPRSQLVPSNGRDPQYYLTFGYGF